MRPDLVEIVRIKTRYLLGGTDVAAVLAEEAETWAGDNRDGPVAKVLDDEKDETEKVKIKKAKFPKKRRIRSF